MANVNVTYQEMRGAAGRLRNGQQEIEAKLADLKRLVESLLHDGYVTDASSKQFETSYTEFNQGALRMIEGLDGMGGYLDAAADTFERADQELSRALK
jgi:WXG100 family type VII secretion target